MHSGNMLVFFLKKKNKKKKKKKKIFFLIEKNAWFRVFDRLATVHASKALAISSVSATNTIIYIKIGEQTCLSKQGRHSLICFKMNSLIRACTVCHIQALLDTSGCEHVIDLKQLTCIGKKKKKKKKKEASPTNFLVRQIT